MYYENSKFIITPFHVINHFTFWIIYVFLNYYLTNSDNYFEYPVLDSRCVWDISYGNIKTTCKYLNYHLKGIFFFSLKKKQVNIVKYVTVFPLARDVGVSTKMKWSVARGIYTLYNVILWKEISVGILNSYKNDFSVLYRQVVDSY